MPTPITVDVDNLTKWAGFIAGFFTTLGLIVRFLTKYIRTDRQETAIANADISIYKKLQDEIARLERIIILQQASAEEAETKWNALRDLEIEGAIDMGQLTMVLTHMPCTICATPTESIHQLADIVARMNSRRLERQKVIRSEDLNG